jgi:hypothetical protein
MAFVHECSCEIPKSELDIFSVPPTQTSIEHGTFVEYHPISSISQGAPIEFEVSSSGEDYLDLADSYLYVKAKIQRANGADMEDDDQVGPVNNFIHSLFSEVEVSLNGTMISASTATYPYRAYIENLLNYGSEAKQSQLTSELFYKDTAGKMDTANPAANAADSNSGLKDRAQFTNRNGVVDMMGKIHSDIFYIDRYMMNEVGIKLKLCRSKDTFSLMWTGDNAFRVFIVGASLLVRKVKLSPSVFLAHAKTLENGMAKYPIKRVICKSFTVPAGCRDVSNERLFSGSLPTRLIIGCVDNDAFNGSKAKNPFNFKHLNLTELSIYLDGQQQGIKPLKCNYGANEYISSYMSLFSGTGRQNRDLGLDINRSDYKNGYALYAFDLTPDMSQEGHFNLIKQGSLRLDMKFGTALPNTVTIIAYGEFENLIEIDRSRNIVFDFNN